MFTRAMALAITVIAAGAFSGCHTPGGGWSSFTGGSHTYYSTESEPKNVALIDLRTDEVIFSIDIPVGKQLAFDFKEGEGDDPVYTPDLMRYAVSDIGTSTGKLRNTLTVPNAASRLIEMTLRTGYEYAQAPVDQNLRTDTLEDRPGWWTPEGGPLPVEDPAVENYDN